MTTFTLYKQHQLEKQDVGKPSLGYNNTFLFVNGRKFVVIRFVDRRKDWLVERHSSSVVRLRCPIEEKGEWCDIDYHDEAKASEAVGFFCSTPSQKTPGAGGSNHSLSQKTQLFGSSDKSSGMSSNGTPKRPSRGAYKDEIGDTDRDCLPTENRHSRSEVDYVQQTPAKESAHGKRAWSVAQSSSMLPAKDPLPLPSFSSSDTPEEREGKRRWMDAACVITSPEKHYHGARTQPRREQSTRQSLLFSNCQHALRPANLGLQSSSSYNGYRSSATFGLRNLGNTCYLNAVMQTFCSLREFVDDLRNMAQTIPPIAEAKLFRCTDYVLQHMNKPGAVLSPDRLRSCIASACPMFGQNEQQDAHEFFLELVNQLHDELLNARSFWLDAMGPKVDAEGETHTLATQAHLDSEVLKRFVCQKCGNSHDIRERFRDFSIDFACTDGVDSCALEGMVTSYFADEVLEVTCEHCGGPSARVQKFLASPPATLVLHLKRFVPNLAKQRYDKRHQFVHIPAILDMGTCLKMAHSNQDGSPPVRLPRPPARPLAAEADVDAKCDLPVLSDSAAVEAALPLAAATAIGHTDREPGGNCDVNEVSVDSMADLSYSLRSIVAHSGSSPQAGHYVAYANGAGASPSWRKYDDSTVTDQEPEIYKKLGSAAYILFYVLNA